ncbi:MAG: HypC/HybG/HupF family hydrogenase formation chaperone [Chloroflexi bacterium]|nr:HypC/HybG/HupF family hydrogenase formation chaperone [Chloroflexota bacterium]
MCLGIPGKIIEIYEQAGLKMGRVDFGGVVKEACLAYVPDAQIGDYTIIHVGFALNVIDEAEAQKTLELFEQIGFLDEELGESDA